MSFFRERVGEGGSPIELSGWALNISRGGVRAIIEDRVELGEELEIDIAEEGLRHRGRIVWMQEELDGTIVGVEFLEKLEAAPPGVELDSSIEISSVELARKLELSPDALKQAFEAPIAGDSSGSGDGDR